MHREPTDLMAGCAVCAPASAPHEWGHSSFDPHHVPRCSHCLWGTAAPTSAQARCSPCCPFLVVERHYSYAAVGVFALAAGLAHALVQPLAGAHGDRGEARWLLSFGLVLAGLGIAAVGVMTSYPLTLLAVAACTTGVAIYHPEGARWARRAAGGRVTANMSVFSLGGPVGYALGPLLVAAVLSPLGLKGTVVIALVPLAAAGAVMVACGVSASGP